LQIVPLHTLKISTKKLTFSFSNFSFSTLFPPPKKKIKILVALWDQDVAEKE